MEDIKHKIEQAQREYNLELAAKLQYGKLPELMEQLKNAKTSVISDMTTKSALSVVSKPASQMVVNNLLETFHSRCYT